MHFISRLKACVMQEPENKNESPKIVVVLRISALLFILALLMVLFAFTFTMRINMALLVIVLLAAYIYVLWCSYHDKIHLSYVLLNIVTVLWVCGFYVLFGQNTGVHHFIFALIVIDLLVDRRHPIRTLVILYVLRVFCMFIENVYTAHEWLPDYMQTYMYLISILIEGAIILINGVYFTRDAFQMENRLQEYNKELEQIASTDPLTGLCNRHAMIEHTNRCLKSHAKGSMSFMSVAIGDIDHFKNINDTYGHECGDEVLRRLSELFKTQMKGIGRVARWGGEEFLFLYENMNGDDAWNELSKLQLKINRLEVPYGDQILHVTMTMGLTEYDTHISLDENIKQADDKLYKGKNSGRNRIVY